MSASRIRALLVEDEVLARLALRQALASHPEVEIVGECGCGAEAVEAVRVLDPDLLFLDIQMPGMDGFELLRALGGEEELPIVVFVTAFSNHALRAFDAQALDYLLKPLDQGRFDSAMERVKAQWRGRKEGAEAALGGSPPSAASPASLAPPAPLAGLGPGGGFLERVSVRRGERIRVLRVGEIDWIAAEGNYVRIHAGGAAFLHRETLSRMEASLDPARFLRIHRGTVVNLDRVKEVTPLFYGDYRLLLADGTALTLSRRFRDRARQALGLP